MRVDDARGTWSAHPCRYPHLEFSEEEDSEGRIPHSFHRRLRMTLDWMCTVYCSVDILLLVTLRMVLNQTHQRGSKAAKFMTSE